MAAAFNKRRLTFASDLKTKTGKEMNAAVLGTKGLTGKEGKS